MIFFTKLSSYISELDEKKLKKYILFFATSVAFIIAIIAMQYFRKINKYKNEINQINTERRKTKEILNQYELVKKQRNDVNALLEKDKGFKIKQYLDDLLNSLQIMKNKKRAELAPEEELDDDYTEIKLEVSLESLNTRELTNFLDAIEKSERVYTKELEINHPRKKASMINVNLTIATLQPKSITSE